MGKNVGKNISNHDHAKQSASDAFKTSLKRLI